MTPHRDRFRSDWPKRRRASGAVLLFVLVILVIMLVASVALVRSTMDSTLMAGNLAFKRDMQVQAARGVAAAEAELRTGALSSATALDSDLASANYSATMLPSSANGIPNMLLDDSAWTMTGADIDDTTAPVTDPSTGKTLVTGLTIRFVIDRLCTTSGPVTNAADCVVSLLGEDKGGTAWLKKAGGSVHPVYRISVRVTGPHDAQTFVQQLISE